MITKRKAVCLGAEWKLRNVICIFRIFNATECHKVKVFGLERNTEMRS